RSGGFSCYYGKKARRAAVLYINALVQAQPRPSGSDLFANSPAHGPSQGQTSPKHPSPRVLARPSRDGKVVGPFHFASLAYNAPVEHTS
ncbi:MAG: hypothetical protein O2795_10740, partial [Acidobacteria bacterium]|nr:hypothetical protein [Acidobacteriota bacterium]